MREPPESYSGRVKALPTEEVAAFVDELGLKTRPFEHQARALVIGASRDSYLFALDMGLGKTKLAIDIHELRSRLEPGVRMLVSCPPIMLPTWRSEIRRHASRRTIESNDAARTGGPGAVSFCVVEGSPDEKRRRFFEAGADVLIVSHPWLTRLMSDAFADAELGRALAARARDFGILVIDEVHRLMNPKTVGFKGYRKFLLSVPRRYLLTGTPVSNNYTGVWALYYLLDRGATFGGSYAGFLKDYFVAFAVRTSNGAQFMKYNIDPEREAEFSALFWSKAVRWEEGDCADLPDKRYITIPVEMTKAQRENYEDAVELADGDSSIPNLMRITAGLDEPSSPKLDALLQVAEEICKERGRRMIIWHWLVDEGKAIEAVLKKAKIPFRSVRGSTTPKDKEKGIEDWRAGRAKVLLANVLSLGVGVSLTEASHCVFFSNNLSSIDRKQAEKRIHRTNQKNTCVYVDLVCRRSVDAVIVRILSESSERAGRLLNGATVLAEAKKAANRA